MNKVWKGLINNQSRVVAACARKIISLAGLAADSSYDNRVEKSSICLIFSFTKQELIPSFEGIWMGTLVLIYKDKI